MKDGKKHQRKKEQQAKKRRTKQKREKAQQNRPVEVQLEVLFSTDTSRCMVNDFTTMWESEDHRKTIQNEFWAGLGTNWRNSVRRHIRLGGLQKMTPESCDLFVSGAYRELENAIHKVFFELHPAYAAFNHSVRVRRTDFLMRFDVYLETLKAIPSRGGNIHMLPKVIFPTNKKFGVTTHAIERMGTRVTGINGEPRPIGGALRNSLVFVPYRKNIFGMYAVSEKSPKVLFNGKPGAQFALLGYLGVKEYTKRFVGVTHLAPGMWKTPEDKKVPEDRLGDYRILTVMDGVVYRALALDPAKPRGDGIVRLQAVPYELDHPEIGILCNLESLLGRPRRHRKYEILRFEKV